MSVYFIVDPHDRVKIGFAADAENRLRTLQTGNPDRLQLLRVIEEARGYFAGALLDGGAK
jgi:hypothetical protein